ncbi:hypothetical protein KTR66_03045 [Roseococcus sp. SDR]|uniref:hypothetical protein n=1 Tax=Roseococcus sp. SDR TaxID=2835532 RepID=UPI001BD0DD44|nr:hypothetical protein [Roseococcus sp. SDR]MBS7788953.1 hypothetical protein [Roseococcus sp. SDR]MBV1844267.1 hypothetical protein [Roseococcus sp. SDR]
MQQPWMPDAPPPPRGVPDDFSRSTAVLPFGRALAVLAMVWLLLLMGRSGAILDAAYGLPILPGTEELIAMAEAWHGAMEAIGVPTITQTLRSVLSWGRG